MRSLPCFQVSSVILLLILILVSSSGCGPVTSATVVAPTRAPSPRAIENSPAPIPFTAPTGIPATPSQAINPTGTASAAPTRPAPVISQSPASGGRATVPPVLTSTIHFDFSSPIVPAGDSKVYGILIDPNDKNLWYVSGQNGLYISRDGGGSWVLNKEIVTQAITLVPQDSNQVYAGVRENLYASADKGQNWKVIAKFDAGTSIRSLHTNRDGTILVGLHWADFKAPGTSPEGIYISRDRGATWQLSSFGTPQRGLIVWAINQDVRDGTIYAGAEISTHPQPYHPPFFRSKDGKTWEEISGIMNWHVTEIQVDPSSGYVYALTEGRGLFGSTDRGDHWKLLSGNVSYGLLLDPNYPNRLFGSTFSTPDGKNGGIFLSTNAGATFTQIGLPGVRVDEIALNGDSTSLYMVIRGSGIVVSKVPTSAR